MSTVATATRPGHRPLVVALGLGVPLGAVTFLLQLTPIGLAANSLAFWALWAFAAGALVDGVRWAITTAASVQLVGLVTWYGITWSIGQFTWSAGGPRALVWGAAALVAGTVFGVAGTWWRNRPGTTASEAGIALIASVHAWSALYRYGALGYFGWGTVDLVTAVVLLLALGRTARERLRAAGMAVPLIALGIGGGVLLLDLIESSGAL
ncbi:DUF6518 family protein [Actinokineospora sp. PR83]|uniref:DUF6518 family protein n=1 Tax=Actinokineospora sp. PR83 TaxID=2884908 RepID=UPI0027E15BC5|nr:DUF6518 family protein [Actinokineospora sp. PR83]MCG8915627.1 DUF6518 family protein [Actinokineospora sp. PR83]